MRPLLLLAAACAIAAAAPDRIVITLKEYNACEVGNALPSPCGSKVAKCYGRRLILDVAPDCFGSARRRRLLQYDDNSTAASGNASYIESAAPFANYDIGAAAAAVHDNSTAASGNATYIESAAPFANYDISAAAAVHDNSTAASGNATYIESAAPFTADNGTAAADYNSSSAVAAAAPQDGGDAKSQYEAWVYSLIPEDSVASVEVDAVLVGTDFLVEANATQNGTTYIETHAPPFILSQSSSAASSSASSSSQSSSFSLSSQQETVSAQDQTSVVAAASSGYQWNLDMINAYELWQNFSNQGENYTVAVLDSGVALSSLPAYQRRIIDGYDFVSSTEDNFSDDGDGRDAGYYETGDPCTDWHGSLVTSVLAANISNYQGVAPAARVVPVRVLGKCKTGYASDVADGIVWAAGGLINGLNSTIAKANIIVMAFAGVGMCPSYMQTAVDLALANNVTLYAAAGNDPLVEASAHFPANCRGVVSVGALNFKKQIASYSSRNADVYMPGGDESRGVPCLDNELVTKQCTGTSMAVPHAAGLQALTGTSIAEEQNNSVWAEFTQVSSEVVEGQVGALSNGQLSYPPCALTGYTNVLSACAYGNGTYIVTYSSVAAGSASTNPIWYLFDGSITSRTLFGQTSTYVPATALYSGSSFLVSGYNGDWVTITLPYAISLESISIYAFSSVPQRAPGNYRLYGSNNAGATWTLLIEVIGAVYTSNIHKSTCTSTNCFFSKYSTFGLVVNKLNTINAESYFLDFSELELYTSLYEDGTQFSRWFADGTANDLSGKIQFTSVTSGTWSNNSGPFPNTASVLNPYYTYAPAVLPTINPVDIRDRSYTISVWIRRECAASPCSSTDTTPRGIWDFQPSGAIVCNDPTKYNLVWYYYANQLTQAYPCAGFLGTTDAKASRNNEWVHLAISTANKGNGVNDEFAMYFNGVSLVSRTDTDAAPTTTWSVLSKMVVGSNVLNGRLFDARFWYTKALSQTEIKRQMCFNGYYWESDATVNGKCTACPAGTYSDLSGAASLSECLPCPSGQFSLAGSSSCSFLYSDGTQFSRWFADGTANDLSGKIQFTSVTSGTWSNNSGPFPNTASVNSDAYVFQPVTLPTINPIDIRGRSYSWSIWVKRECTPLTSPCSDSVDWRFFIWTNGVTCQNTFSGTWSDIVNFYVCCGCEGTTGTQISSASLVRTNNAWIHWSGTLSNSGTTAANSDTSTIYRNGVSISSSQHDYGPMTSWNAYYRLQVATSNTGKMFDARFWYTKALTDTEVRRQMCYNGYYWETDATTGGKCTVCPTGTYSDLGGAASLSECLPCPQGFFTASPGSTSCTPCPAGTYGCGNAAVCSATTYPLAGLFLAEMYTLVGTKTNTDLQYQLGPNGNNLTYSVGTTVFRNLTNISFGSMFISDGTRTVNGYTIPRGYQVWIVPRTGRYEFVAAGAQGASYSSTERGGFGATISTTVSLQRGDIIIMVVGIQGWADATVAAGGGGGTFITKYAASGAFATASQHTIIAIAGGGGGTGFRNTKNGVDASFTTSGTLARRNFGSVATNGGGGGANGANGGNAAAGTTSITDGSGAGGGGFIGDGGSSSTSQATNGGKSFLNGAGGGCSIGCASVSPHGGFGGGGGSWNGGGGGGGYSGGQGDHNDNTAGDGGGGSGGSYDINGASFAATAYTSALWNTTKFGPARSDASGYNAGDGYVLIYFESACLQCAGGLSCVPCNQGQFSLSGSTTCSNCAMGNTTNGTGASQCTACSTGTYSLASGAPFCAACASSGNATEWYQFNEDPRTTSTLIDSATGSVAMNMATVPNSAFFHNTTGMLGWYRFDAGALTVNSATAGTYALTDSGSVASEVADVRAGTGAARFSGSNSYSIASAAQYFAPVETTVSAWVKVRSHTDWQIIAAARPVGAFNGWGLNVFPSNNANFPSKFVLEYANSARNGFNSIASGTAVTSVLTWYHVAVAWKDGDAKLYVNGILEAVSAATYNNVIATTTELFYVGVLSTNSYRLQANSIVDDLRIYNRILTQAEISALYSYNTLTRTTGYVFNGDTTGLQVWYTFDSDDMKLKNSAPGTGVTYDLINTGATFSSANTIPSSSGSMVFSGSSTFVSNANVNLGGISFSIAFWVRLTNVAQGTVIMIQQPSGSVAVAHQMIFVSWETTLWRFSFGTASSELDLPAYANPSTDVLNKWMHVVCTYDLSTRLMSVYINNNAPVTKVAAASSVPPTGTWRIGAPTLTSWNGFAGNLDDFRIYNRVISASEVSALYNYGLQSKPATNYNALSNAYSWATDSALDLSSNLLGWYKLDRGTQTTNSGIGGSSYTLTEVGGTVASETSDYRVGTGAATFSGSNYYNVANAAQYFAPVELTISVWIKVKTHTTWQTVASARPSNAFNGWAFNVFGSSHGTYPNKLVFEYPNDARSVWNVLASTTTVTSTLLWYHVLATVKNADSKIYVNGILETTSTATYNNVFAASNDPFCIGTLIGGTPVQSGTIIDDVRIYNRILSAQEVLALYNLDPQRRALSPADNIYLAYQGSPSNIQSLLNSFHVAAGFSLHFLFRTSSLSATSQLLYIGNTFGGDLIRVFVTNNVLTFEVANVMCNSTVAAANVWHTVDMTWSLNASSNAMTLATYYNNFTVAATLTAQYNNLLLNADLTNLNFFIGRAPSDSLNDATPATIQDLRMYPYAITYSNAGFQHPVIRVNSVIQSATLIQGTNDYFFAFTSTSATNTITFQQDTLCDILIVGGGGGGGYQMAGGGGSGGAIYATGFVVPSGGSYTVTVGNGGAGGISTSTAGTNGGSSSAFGATALGGGGGGGIWESGQNGNNGGSGGGAGGSEDGQGNKAGGLAGTNLLAGSALYSGIVTNYNGNPGGMAYPRDYFGTWRTGGGGGGGIGTAGAAGVKHTVQTFGDGGNGLPFTITGISITFAGGGGGGAYAARGGNGGTGGAGGGGCDPATQSVLPGAGSVGYTDGSSGSGNIGGNAGINTGSGGGGGGYGVGGVGSAGGAGGSGIVIIRYRAAQLSPFVAPSINASTCLATSSSTCAPGSFGNATSGSCQPCPANTFSATANATNCTPCAAGSSSGLGSASCTPCAAGTFINSSFTACQPCPINTFSASAGSTSCTACSAGWYAPSFTANTQCFACPAGTYFTGVVGEWCLPCPPGTSSGAGATQCAACGPGYFAAA